MRKAGDFRLYAMWTKAKQDFKKGSVNPFILPFEGVLTMAHVTTVWAEWGCTVSNVGLTSEEMKPWV